VLGARVCFGSQIEVVADMIEFEILRVDMCGRDADGAEFYPLDEAS
jgi:hypothetical protein